MAHRKTPGSSGPYHIGIRGTASQHKQGIICSPYGPHNVPDVHIYTTFQQAFRQCADRIALVDTNSGESYTFRHAERRIEAIARRMYRDGFRSGDRLALCCTNCVEYPMFIAATLRLNGTVVGINHMLTKDDIVRQVEISRARFIFTGYDITAKVMTAVEHTNAIVYVAGSITSPKYTTTADILRDLNGVFPQLPAVCEFAVDPRTEAGFILFSSGTTGFPKPVLLSHAGMIVTSYNLHHPEISMVESKQVVYQPMCHIFGMNLVVLTFMLGVTSFVMPKFDLEKYVQLVAMHKIPMIHVVPPVAVMLSKSPLLDKYDLTCIHNISSGAGPIGGDTEQLLIRRLKSDKVRFRQVYGMTETSGIITLSPTAGHRLANVPTGSVGLLAPNTQVKVIDINTMTALGPDTEGEIWVKGPQLMLEYEGRLKETKDTIDEEGWLHTGDIGKYDSNGFFFITDRMKELIKYKGYQVAPVELEHHLVAHPGVQDAAVFSVPDPVAGELPRAWIMRKPGYDISQADIHTFINARVAPYKKLRGGVRFVDSLPRSASGKILRREIKKAEKISSKL